MHGCATQCVFFIARSVRSRLCLATGGCRSGMAPDTAEHGPAGSLMGAETGMAGAFTRTGCSRLRLFQLHSVPTISSSSASLGHNSRRRDGCLSYWRTEMRYLLLALSMLLFPALPSHAQLSIGIGIELPGISLGINLPAYPAMVRVPGYPVYYAPRLNFNFFFYDGLYWAYEDDRWYASDWYNGPWWEVEPEYMPLFVLRVPIRYYRRPPMYFRYWRADRAPRWDEHWGRDWSERHRDWDRWDQRSAPAPAPLPHYQRQYSERNYPRSSEQLREIRSRNYRYQPREEVTQQHFQQRGNPSQPRMEQQQQRPDVRQSPGRQPAPDMQRQPVPNQPRTEQQQQRPDVRQLPGRQPAPDVQRQPVPNQQRTEPQQQRPDVRQAPGRQPQQDAPRQSAPGQPRIEQPQQRPDMQRQPQGNPNRSRTEQRQQDSETRQPPQQRQPSRGRPPTEEELLLEQQQQRGRDRHN